MSLNRVNPRRDENEPQIRKRFAEHGWHTEQVSGKGMPDLIVWPVDPVVHLPHGRARTLSALVDVKMPKGKLKPAQEKKWAGLAEKGIAVYVVRAEEDVDALVRGELEPWLPTSPILRGNLGLASAQRVRKQLRSGPMGMGHAVEPLTRDESRIKAAKRAASVVPCASRTNPMATKAIEPSNAAEHRALLAAREAEETFAPGPVDWSDRERVPRALPRGEDWEPKP